MTNLPIEIWQQIHQHVPKNEAKHLYAVNRALYYIVMSEKYAHVRCEGGGLSAGHLDKPLAAHALRYFGTVVRVDELGSHSMTG